MPRLHYLTIKRNLSMKKIKVLRNLVLTVASLCMVASVTAQGDKSKRPSPPETAKGKVGGANITIDYSSPSVKGRPIWGSLVPWDKAWRAGANEATVFTTDKAIKIEGKDLPAGKYSLFAIPNEKEWTIILNSQTGQWGIKDGGEANRDPAKDVLTVKVQPKKVGASKEQLTYTINGKGFVLAWEKYEVPVGIKG
jgi:hypothetical protein